MNPAPPDTPTRAVPHAADLVADDLVRAGLLDTDDRDRAVATITRTLTVAAHDGAPAARPAEPIRRRLAEVLGYVGGVLVVCAGVLFVGQQWADLERAQRLVLLTVVTLVLWGVGAAVIASAGGRAAVRAPAQEVRRRLASVLLTGGAGTAAGVAGTALIGPHSPESPGRMAAVFAVLAVVALAGYLLSASAVGQLGVATGVLFAVGFALDGLDLDRNEGLAIGVAILAIGVGWAALAELGRWREQVVARLLGCGIAFLGTQVIVASHDRMSLGYAAAFVLAVAAFGVYLTRRAWPYLTLGVVALTAAVTEAAVDLFDDALGAAGGLLVAGVALLGSSLLGLRLRREVAEDAEDAHPTA